VVGAACRAVLFRAFWLLVPARRGGAARRAGLVRRVDFC
ncbi:hypothetical protein A2U01_0102992, partial [Trifolium medium]|nr:hypothetical protein [Trifolium medium]